MRAVKAARCRVSPSVKRWLASIVRSSTCEHREVIRARIVLLAGAGLANAEIARRVGCHEDTVRKWRSRFSKDPRAESLLDRPRSGRPPKINVATRCELIKLACSPPPESLRRSRWTQAALACALEVETRVRISKSEVGRLLRERELRPHRMRLWLHSPDPDFRRKVKRICRLYTSPPPGATVLCIDEKTQMQALKRRFPTRLPRPGEDGRFEFEYRRKGVLALLAALDVRTGSVLGKCVEHRTGDALVAFMEEVAREYPRGPIYIVWDNLDIHRDGPSRRWSKFNARHGGRFHFVHTPLHASWINQIEIWFSILDRRALRHASFDDKHALRRAVLGFLKRWNQHEAHPFRWTFRGRFNDDRRRAA